MDKQTEKNLKSEIKELKKLNRLMDRELDIVHKYLTKFYNYTPGMDDEPVVTVKECLAKIDKLYENSEEEPKSMNWISVKERLPEETKRVLCLTSSGLYSVGYYYKNTWQADAVYHSFEERGYTVTHWQPLPDKPEDVA
jgi:hypothetical protein